ncbi:MAG: hypothetical protein HQ511_07045 [Rhodospirillales bacterium]|nr:hypothetical protein [Rhodospirillales bacterium]
MTMPGALPKELEGSYMCDDRPWRIPDSDIHACALLLFERHGDAAERLAKDRADELLAGGDTEGHLMCSRIAEAIQGFQG